MNDYNESLHKTEITKYRIECAGRMTGRVLDVGGGLGSYLPYFNSDDITVLDADKETLDKLKYKNKVLGDAAKTPFEESSFDSIWACAVAEYLDCTLDEFISEMKRICVGGGQNYHSCSKWKISMGFNKEALWHGHMGRFGKCKEAV